MKRKLQFSAILALAVFATCFIVPHLIKAAMVELTLDELAGQSSEIVRGQVTGIESYWNEDKTFIFTTVSVQVDESYKGSLKRESSVAILVPGGEVGEVGLGVEHAPHFEYGQEVIVFLREIEESLYGVTAWEQGKYTIENDMVNENEVSVSAFKKSIEEALK
jgi:hypothetical protein